VKWRTIRTGNTDVAASCCIHSTPYSFHRGIPPIVMITNVRQFKGGRNGTTTTPELKQTQDGAKEYLADFVATAHADSRSCDEPSEAAWELLHDQVNQSITECISNINPSTVNGHASWCGKRQSRNGSRFAPSFFFLFFSLITPTKKPSLRMRS